MSIRKGLALKHYNIVILDIYSTTIDMKNDRYVG